MPQDARDLKGKTGIRRLINATRYSRDGFAKAFRTEEAFRQESILSVVGLVALFFIPAAFTLKLFAVFALVFLLVTELLNSGVEAAIDRIGPEIHPMSKYAKDAGSCAVLFALTFCIFVWCVLLWDAFVSPLMAH